MFTISSIAVSPVPPQGTAVVRAQPVAAVKVSDTVSPDNQGVQVPVTSAGEGSKAQLVYKPSPLPPVNPTDEAARANNFNNSATPERIGDLALRASLGPSVGLGGPPTANPAEATDPTAQAAAADEADANNDLNATRQATEGNPTAAQEVPSRRPDAPAFEGQLPAPVPNPAMQAMDTQIKELLPNMWKASRAAVDVLIGEEARAAAAARAEVFEGRPPNTDKTSELADNYTRTSTLPEPPSTGRSVDRLV